MLAASRCPAMPLAAVLATLGAGACGSPAADERVVSTAPGDGPDWFSRVVTYQVFVRSFQDSDGDGIGDLEGLTRRLDYLAALGVGAVWLMPVYPSPLRDSGYDVADYRGIHDDYGDLEQFRRLVDEAHRRNIKVLLDLVINHTSDQHSWFQESRLSRDGPRADWYVWSDEPGGSCDETNFIFGTERWTLDPVRGQYFFHQFFATQPDLNFRSASLTDELLHMVRWWLDRGVDGFRVDVPYQYVENWPHCWHQPETFEFHRRLRATLDAYPARAMIGEVCCSPEEVIRYLGNGGDAFHAVFYFPAMYALWRAVGNGAPAELADAVRYAAENVPAGGLAAVTLGNHDFLRTPTTVGADPAALELAATAQLTLPGPPFVYYGEELGLRGGSATVVDFRDAARTPMPWDSTPNAGFTTGTPWLPLAEGAETTSVEAETGRDGSLLEHYRTLIALRNRTPALQVGSYEEAPTGHPAALAFWRRDRHGDRLVVLHFGATAEADVELVLPAEWAAGGGPFDELSGRRAGAMSGTTWSVVLPPRSALILRPAGP
jgi:glycosidase